MSKIFSVVVLALAAVSSVSGAAIPRATPPQGWRADLLESYDVYHTRYMALACQTQHSQAFFAACCSPLKQGETLEANRPAECTPNSPAYTSAMIAESPAPSSNDDGGDDCGDDEPSSTSTFVPSTPASEPSSTDTPEPSSTTPATTFTPKPESTTTPHTSTTHSSTPPAPSSTSSGSGGGQTFTDGVATYFTQNGVAGACGTVHSDDDLIAAIDQDRYGNSGETSSLCGKQVSITNTKNGKNVVVTIADDCPTCINKDSIDLSVGAFTKIATEEEGEVNISWQFL